MAGASGAYNYGSTGAAWTSWTTSCTGDTTWYDWNTSSATTSITLTHDKVWYGWVAADTQWVQPQYQAPTAEQVAAAELRIAEAAVAEQARKDAAAVADARAQQLLAQALSGRQRQELADGRAFVVDGQSGRRYRIRAGKGRHGNIEELDDAGVAVRSLCCAPTGEMPEADALLAQKLWLEMDEETFRRTANFTDLRRRDA